MVARIAESHLSYAEYLLFEERSDVKHEWYGGEIFAMAGGTPEHAALAAAMIIELASLLRGRPCRVYSSDLRVVIPATGLATYPDVTVVCGRLENHPEDKLAATNPTLIVEVLSDTTEAYDRGEKFEHYRKLPSLREYVLVNQKKPLIEKYERQASRAWLMSEHGPGETVTLTAGALSIDAVYRNPLEAA